MSEKALRERLKELRAKKGMTQKALADALNVTASAVSKWENGLNAPDVETLQHIARYYNITFEELMGDALQKTERECESSVIPCNTLQDKSAQERTIGNKLPKGEGGSKKKWLAAGIGIGCGFMMLLGLIILAVWHWSKPGFSYEIVAERYAEDANWGEVYEVSVFYKGELNREVMTEVSDILMKRWERMDLCTANIETIKVIYNEDQTMAESFYSNSEAPVQFIFPYDMIH